MNVWNGSEATFVSKIFPLGLSIKELIFCFYCIFLGFKNFFFPCIWGYEDDANEKNWEKMFGNRIFLNVSTLIVVIKTVYLEEPPEFNHIQTFSNPNRLNYHCQRCNLKVLFLYKKIYQGILEYWEALTSLTKPVKLIFLQLC